MMAVNNNDDDHHHKVMIERLPGNVFRLITITIFFYYYYTKNVKSNILRQWM